jgi:hypothetical protein
MTGAFLLDKRDRNPLQQMMRKAPFPRHLCMTKLIASQGISSNDRHEDLLPSLRAERAPSAE